MKLEFPKPATLSVKQSKLWHAVDSSQHNIADIAKHCGYHRAQIVTWLRGYHEPVDFNYNTLMQGIDELSTVTPNHRIKWDSRVAMLAEYRAQGMNYSEIARKLKGDQSSVRQACIRNGLAA